MDSLIKENYISTSEASKLSGYHSDYISKLVRDGKIQGSKIGRSWFVEKNSVLAFVKEQAEHKALYAEALAREREEEYKRTHQTVRTQETAEVTSTLPKVLAQPHVSTNPTADTEHIAPTVRVKKVARPRHAVPSPYFDFATATLTTLLVLNVSGFVAQSSFPAFALETSNNTFAYIAHEVPVALHEDMLQRSNSVLAYYTALIDDVGVRALALGSQLRDTTRNSLVAYTTFIEEWPETSQTIAPLVFSSFERIGTFALEGTVHTTHEGIYAYRALDESARTIRTELASLEGIARIRSIVRNEALGVVGNVALVYDDTRAYAGTLFDTRIVSLPQGESRIRFAAAVAPSTEGTLGRTIALPVYETIRDWFRDTGNALARFFVAQVAYAPQQPKTGSTTNTAVSTTISSTNGATSSYNILGGSTTIQNITNQFFVSGVTADYLTNYVDERFRYLIGRQYDSTRTPGGSGGSVDVTNISGSTITSSTFSGTSVTTDALTLGTLNGPLQANNGVVSATTSIGAIYGGTGQTTYNIGDLLYADTAGSLARLPIGVAGQVLKISGGLPSWGTDITGGGGSGAWATTTDSLAIYPADTTNVVLVGTNATSTTGNILEVAGNVLLRNILTAYGTITAPIFTATSTTATSTFPNIALTNIGIGGDYFTDLTGTGLSNVGGALTLNTGGDWTGTFDGQEGSYYLNATNLTNFGTPFYTFFSATTTDALAQGSTNRYYSDTLVNAYIHASTTIPKTYTNNTFTGNNTYNGTVTLGTLNGPLQSNNGVVSATSSIGVLYGGTGLTIAPSYGQLLVGNGSGGYALTATSSLGLPTNSDLANYLTLSAWYATTTDGLDEGITNLYFTDARARSSLSETITGIDYTSGTGVFSLTAGYTIPLTASTTEWATAYSWGDHSTAGYENALTVTYPITRSGDTLSLAFGTTTSNTWSGTQTFTNNPILGALSGLIGANNGTLYQIATSSNFVTSITAGTGISVSGNTGAITINATGGGGSGNVATSSSETAGALSYWTSTAGTPATLGSVATTSVTIGSGLSYSGTFGSVVGGVGGTLSLNTSGDWTGTFDGQEGSYYLNATNLTNFGTPFYTFFSATTTDALAQGSTNRYYSDTLVNAYIHASTTIPKTYTNNTFTGNNTYNGTVTLGTLNGPLQSNNGVVSATSSIGVLYGGTGLTIAPSYGQLLVGNGSGGYALTATSSLGLPTNSDLANYLTLSAWYATTTDGLDEGITNLYFTDARARSSLSETITGIDYTSGTGVFSLTAGYTIPLTASTTEWATAYSWGDHSTAGYENALTVTYPITRSGDTLSLAFGTTTSNTWAGTQTFTNTQATNATTSTLGITGLVSSLLSTNAGGSVIATTSISGNFLDSAVLLSSELDTISELETQVGGVNIILSTEIDSIGELETLLGSVNVILATEIDTESELETILTDVTNVFTNNDGALSDDDLSNNSIEDLSDVASMTKNFGDLLYWNGSAWTDIATSSLGLVTSAVTAIGPTGQTSSGPTVTLATSTGSFNGLSLGTTIVGSGNTQTFTPSITGTLDNAGLTNSSVSYGGVSLSLGGTDATPAFNLQDATGLPISTGVSGLAANIATFLGTPSSANLDAAVTDDTGSGALVFATSPTLVTPDLGTPSAVTLTNATGLPISTGLSGAGTGVLTALGVNVGTAGAFVVNGGALGTPSSGTLTNATGLPIVGGTTGTLSIARGGTGTTTAPVGQVLYGGSGSVYQSVATTSVTIGSGLSYSGTFGSVLGGAAGTLSLNTSGDWTGTFDGQEGSYYLNATNLTNFGTPFYTFFSATTTDALAQGATNRYYSDTLVNAYIHASTTIPKTYTNNTFTTLQTFGFASTTGISASYASSTAGYFGTVTLGTLNGPLQAVNGLVSATSSISQAFGGTGITSYTAGDLLYADSGGNLTKLAIGSAGQVLKVTGGLPSWGADLTTGGGGGATAWSTTTDSLAIHPSDTSDVLIVGNSATTTANSILEIFGRSYFSDRVGIGTTSPWRMLSVAGNSDLGVNALAGTFTATSTSATSTLPNLSTTNVAIGSDYFTDLTGTGLSNVGGALTLNATGDWTGTFDGQEGTYYLARANHTGTQTASTISDFDSAVNAYIHASTTIPKTYTTNTFTALQTLTGGLTTNALTVATLNGPLQANNGVVSATTSIGVLYGGTGLTTAPSYGQLLVGNASGGYTLTATSSLGLVTSAVTAIGPTGQTQTGPTVTTATSTGSFNGLTTALTIVGSGNTLTYTPSITGTLDNAGLTNSSVSYGGVSLSLGGSDATPAFNLADATGLPISTGVSGLGTGIATALGINVGSAGAPVLFNGALGTPSSGTLTNATGLPIVGGTTGTLSIARGGTGTTTAPVGQVLYGGSGSVYQSVATTSVTIGSGLSYSGTFGSVLGGAAGTLSLNTSGDWTGTFDGQEGTYYLARANHTGTQTASTISDFSTTARGLFSGTFPIAYNSGTGAFTFNGLSTSTAAVVGNIPYFSGANTFANVATSTATLSGAFSYSGTLGSLVGGSAGTLSLATNGVALTNLAQIAANSILGNVTGAAGNVTAIATSSLFTWTGTGDVVRATSPTLVTPNLGTPSAITLTNGTGLPISTGVSGLGTGVATFLATPSSANLASALTDESGAAGVFPRFSLSGQAYGDVTIWNGTNWVNTATSSLGLPTYAYPFTYGTTYGATAAATSTALWAQGGLYASSTVAFGTAGNSFNFDSTTGYVGLGTTSPVAPLTITTSGPAWGTNGWNRRLILGGSIPSIQLGYNNGGARFGIGNNGTGTYFFNTTFDDASSGVSYAAYLDGTTRNWTFGTGSHGSSTVNVFGNLAVGSSYYNTAAPSGGLIVSGNVGIGTSTPVSKLHVEGANSAAGGITISSSAGSAYQRFAIYPSGNTSTAFQKLNSNGVLSFLNSAGGEEARIDNSGNLGLGTSTPNTRLTLAASGANGLNLDADTANSTLSSRLFLSTGTAGQSLALTNNAGSWSFQTGATPGSSSGSERVRITSGGNVGIGTTSPYAKLSVVGQTVSEYFTATSTTAVNTFPLALFTSATTTNFGINSETFTDLTGTGLSNVGGALTLNATGDWTGTFDGQEGTYYLARANHTGTQTASTISDFNTAVNSYIHSSTTIPKTYTNNVFTGTISSTNETSTAIRTRFIAGAATGSTSDGPLYIQYGRAQNVYVGDGSNASSLIVQNGYVNATNIQVNGNGALGRTGTNLQINSTGLSDAYLTLYSTPTGGSATERVRVTADGLVGIGTTSPYAKLSVVGQTVSEYFTATSTTAVNTFPLALFTSATTTALGVNSETFTDLTGTGLSNVGGALTLNATGDWTGTFDGQEGTYYLARANHTGTQTASTISDFSTTARGLFSGTFPIAYNSGTGAFTFNGLSTSTAAVVGNIPYFSGANTFANVATSTATLSGAFSYSGTLGSLVGGSAGTLSLATNGVALTNLAQIAANSILGNVTGAAGNVTAIATSSLFTWTGTGDVVRATSPTLVTPNLGTPSAITLTNGTGLPISTGVSGLGTGIATFLATPSSANLAGALTDESGAAGVFPRFSLSGQAYGDTVIWNGTNWVNTATSSLGLVTSAVTAIGPAGQTADGPTVIFATSSTAFNGLTASTTITGSGDTLTFTNTLAGLLGIAGGGTGATSFTNNRLLTGNGTGALVDEANLTFDGSLLTVTGNASTTQLTTTGSTYLATTGGNVGIGTASPDQLLELEGNNIGLHIDSSTGAALYIDRGAANNYAHLHFQTAGVNRWFAGLADSDVAGDGTEFFIGQTLGGGSASLWLETNGNVGIGTTSPASALHIQAASTPELSIQENAAGKARYSFAASTNFATRINGTDYLTLQSDGDFIVNSGNVGIGTTSPYAKLSVTNTGSNPSFVVEDSSSPDSTPFIIEADGRVGIGSVPNAGIELHVAGEIYASGGVRTGEISSQYIGSATPLTLRGGSSSGVILTTDNGEIMRATSGGNVGIGTTSPQKRLEIYDTTANAGIRIDRSTLGYADIYRGSGSYISGQSLIFEAGGSNAMHFLFKSNPAVSDPNFVIRSNGNVGIGTTSPWRTLSVLGSSDLGTNALAGTFTATSTSATSTFPNASITNLAIGGDYLTDLVGTGLQVVSGALTLNATGDWTGTFDGQEGTYYLARANHTGTQTASTISDFSTTARGLFSGTFPIAYNSGTGAFTFNGLSTSTAAVVGNIPYFSGANTFANVATSTATLSGAFSYSGTLGSLVGGSAGTLSLATNGVALTNLAQIAANSILGNVTGAAGNVTAIATSSLFTWTGTGDVVRATSPTLVTPNLGTPSAITLTNGTGLPISTGVSGLGTGVATFLATPSSANLASALTDESGAAGVFPRFSLSGQAYGDVTIWNGTNWVNTATSSLGLASNALTNGYVFRGSSSNTAEATSTLFIADAGNVGVGATNPGGKLDVRTGRATTTAFVVSGNSGSEGLRFWADDNTSYIQSIQDEDTATYGNLKIRLGDRPSQTPTFSITNYTSGSDSTLLTLLSTGNLGIGSSSPTGTLTIGSGQILVPDGSASVPSVAFSNRTDSGIWYGSTVVRVAAVGTDAFGVANNSIRVPAASAIGWCNSASTACGLGTTMDLTLFRDATNTLAQRNGTNAQVFNIYATSTNTSNYERLSIDTSSNVITFASQAAGYGTARNFNFSGGNLGIGTTSPYAKLSVVGEVVGANFTATTTGTNTFPNANISKLVNLTSNGLVTTGSGDGTLSITVPGTGVLTALGVNVGTAGAFVVNGGALGTPSSGTLTNATGLPISTGVSGLGTGVATFLGTPSSANLAAALTDESGAAGVFPRFSLSGQAYGDVTIWNGTNWVNVATSSLGITSGSTITFGTDNQIPYTNSGGTDFDYSANFTFDGTSLGIGTSSPYARVSLDAPAGATSFAIGSSTGTNFVVNAAGNVGIGTASPTAYSGMKTLALNGTNSGRLDFLSNGTRYGSAYNVSGNFIVGNTGAGNLELMTDLTTRVYIDSVGNVGIGTSTPGTLLSLGDSGNDTINISATATSTFGSGINIRSGCFAVNGVCVGGGGVTAIGPTGQTADGPTVTLATSTGSFNGLTTALTITGSGDTLTYTPSITGTLNNAGLTNSSVSYGGVSLSLGGTDATPAFNLQDATGLPISTGVAGLGTGVATALGVNVGTAGAFVVNGGALGTPSSGTLTNATGLPIVGGTTGTLTVARGGTGTTTAPVGQVLYGGSGSVYQSVATTSVTIGSGLSYSGTFGSVLGGAAGTLSLNTSGDWTGTLDSLNASDFLRSNASDSYTSGTLTFDAATALDLNTTSLSIADTSIAFDGASTDFTFTGNFTANTDDLNIVKSTGYVGVGTTTPYRNFAVQGAVNTDLAVFTTTNTSGPGLRFEGNGTYDGRVWRLLAGGSGNTALLGATGNFGIVDGTANAARLVINSSGSIGIGTSSPQALVNTYKLGTDTASGTSYLDLREFILNPGSASSHTFVGDRSDIQTLSTDASNYNILIASAPRVFHNGAGTVTDMRGVNLVARNTGSGAVTSGTGGNFEFYNDSSGTVTTGRAGRFLLTASGGTVTNAHGIYIDIANSGTMTNTYGLYIDDITDGTQTNTPYSIYSSDANAYNYFAGNVGIGTTTPGSILSVQGVGNFTTATSTLYSSGGINLTGGGCFAINGTCVGGSGGGLSSSDIDTSAELAAILTDETGTAGSVVFSGAPTLTGNTTVGTLTLTGNTIFGAAGTFAQIVTNTDFYLDLDQDNNSSNSFFVRDGADSNVLTVTEAGVLTAASDIYATGTYYYGDSKAIVQYSDSWLRLNPTSAFTSGIYAGVGVLRTDGTFQVGSAGATLSIASGGDLTLGTGIQVDFTDEVADKLYLFSNTYGIGIESSTLTNWSGSQFRWRIGGTSSSGGTEYMFLNSTGLGIGSSTPSSRLSVTNAVSTAQVMVAYDGTRYSTLLSDSSGDLNVVSSGNDIRMNNENLWVCTGGSCPSGSPSGQGNLIVETSLGVGSSTPWAGLSVASGKAIVVGENTLATSTSMSVDWRNGNQQLIRIGTAGTTISFTGYVEGQKLALTVCNPNATAGAISWGTQILWPGGTAPTQTTTANKCDVWSFLATTATSTLRIFGTQSANF